MKSFRRQASGILLVLSLLLQVTHLQGKSSFRPGPVLGSFAAGTPCNDGWRDGPGVNGIDGYAYSMAVDSGGNLIVGGSFKVAGNTVAHNIAKWDGTNWSAIGSGTFFTQTSIPSVVVSGDDIYAAVALSNFGSSFRSYVYKWNGISWAVQGSELSGYISSIALSGTTIYAAQTDQGLGFIRRWNGGTWETVGAMDDPVDEVAVSGGSIFVGGAFTTVNGMPAAGIAKWNGSSWSALGSGTNGYVRSMAVAGGDVYVGGDFTVAGGIPVGRIARWNGTTWSPLGPGMNNYVVSLALSGTDLYAAGHFTSAGGVPADGIAKWNGTGWSDISQGAAFWGESLAVSGQQVYAGGRFIRPSIEGIAKWNGSNWSSLGSGVVSKPADFAVSETGVYAAGYFTVDDGVTVSPAARWNGSGWDRFAPLPDADVQPGAVAVSGTDLYVGGTRSLSVGTADGFVYKWNGTGWVRLGTGIMRTGNSFQPVISALAVSGTDVYVGGDFTHAGGGAANDIAKWNGTNWTALGGGLTGGYPSTVYDLAVADGNVYAGGGFTSAGGTSARFVAKWNGAAWQALGPGPVDERPNLEAPHDTFDAVTDIEISGPYVYAAGGLGTDYGEGQGFVSKWDGSQWSRSPWTYWNPLYAMTVYGNEAYAGGDDRFTSAGPTHVNHIAKWDGSNWSGVDTGLGGLIPWTTAMATFGSEVFVAGRFTMAGCHVSAHFARYTPFGSGPGLEGDLSPRPNGDGIMLATDIVQIRRFAAGLDTPSTSPNEYQRSDCAPRSTLGDGVITSSDVVQARRYVAGLDQIISTGGPVTPALRP